MILKLSPSLKNYVWGGTNLKTKWNKTSDEPKLAESWELSLNQAGLSRIEGGKYGGRLLGSVLSADDFGENCKGFQFFPVLVKLIDSAAPLSLQVHPTDAYALKREHKYGKTEMWHILDAAPNAYIYLGFKTDVTKPQFVEAAQNKTLCDLLNKVPVAANQTYFVPSGTIHAIGAGVTLLEIQQNSDLTYRVYDYDRLDADGCPRELHTEKALEVLNFRKYVVPSPSRHEFLGRCKYFAAYAYQGKRILDTERSFASVTCLSGETTVGKILLKKGETAFVSAGTTAEADGGRYAVVTVERR